MKRVLQSWLILILVLASFATPGTVGAAAGISVAPQAGPAGTQFQLSGAGLVPQSEYSVLVEAEQTTGRRYSLLTDAKGAFRLTFDSTDYDTNKHYTVNVVQKANSAVEATSRFIVTTIQPERCFSETGFCVRGRFLTYWEEHGGLLLNGFPLSGEFNEVLEDGRPYVVQYFERTRLEYHAQAADPQSEVVLGQFGRRIRPADPPAMPDAAMVWFPQTGHNVPNDFYRFWSVNGGIAQFGFPLSEPFAEQLENGQVYRVQYFERARLEYHPENPAPHDILLGQFGRMILAIAQP